MTRLLVVNADDFGLTPGVCEGIFDAYDHGIVTSTSALVVAPAWSRYARALADSGLGVGAHLCVVGEDPPLLTAAEVPTLVDDRGRFPRTWREFVTRASLGRVDSNDLRRELSAQMDALVGARVRLTHVDSHQNLHQFPQVAAVVVELARRHAVGAARCTRSAGRGPVQLGVRVLSGAFARRCERAGLVVPASSAGLDGAGHLSLDRMVSAIAALGRVDAASAELATHPGIADDPDRLRYAWGYRWAEELEALRDPATRRAVAAAGFRLGDFADLVALGGGHRAPA